MFGRRKHPPEMSGPGSPPPPPGGGEPFPIDKMDRALEAAIGLFTRALDEAGVDAGQLALRGQVPADVGGLVAGCTTYRDGATPTYLALGISPDFKAMAYPPHCRLFFILNSVGICEDPAARSLLNDLAPHQLPGPLIDAHFMRRWIRFILPTADAMKQGQAALESMMRRMVDELVEVAAMVPRQFAERIDLELRMREWASGFPAVIGRPLDDSVPRMNGLPMTPFIENVLTNELARLQADRLRQQRG
jgi:hypothetical protein